MVNTNNNLAVTDCRLFDLIDLFFCCCAALDKCRLAYARHVVDDDLDALLGLEMDTAERQMVIAQDLVMNAAFAKWGYEGVPSAFMYVYNFSALEPTLVEASRSARHHAYIRSCKDACEPMIGHEISQREVDGDHVA